jgi:hypothetical protein
METPHNFDPAASPTQPMWGNPGQVPLGQVPQSPTPQVQIPLGRIVLGVVIGLAIWSAIMLGVFMIMMFGFFHLASNLIDDALDKVHSDTSTSSGLSDACENAIRSGDLDKLQDLNC